MKHNEMLTDVRLEVVNEVFHAHKIILAAASPYFKGDTLLLPQLLCIQCCIYQLIYLFTLCLQPCLLVGLEKRMHLLSSCRESVPQ